MNGNETNQNNKYIIDDNESMKTQINDVQSKQDFFDVDDVNVESFINPKLTEVAAKPHSLIKNITEKLSSILGPSEKAQKEQKAKDAVFKTLDTMFNTSKLMFNKSKLIVNESEVIAENLTYMQELPQLDVNQKAIQVPDHKKNFVDECQKMIKEMNKEVPIQQNNNAITTSESKPEKIKCNEENLALLYDLLDTSNGDSKKFFEQLEVSTFMEVKHFIQKCVEFVAQIMLTQDQIKEKLGETQKETVEKNKEVGKFVGMLKEKEKNKSQEHVLGNS